MGTPYLGEIRLTSFDFAPRGWAMCDGQLLSIQQNTALFALLGTYYGGDGVRTFGLPNLQARSPMHQDGGQYAIGTSGGESAHTLTAQEMPAHSHSLRGSAKPGASSSPAGGLLAAEARGATPAYAAATNFTPLNAAALAATGGSQPHDNMMPFLTLNFVIALQGIFPSRS